MTREELAKKKKEVINAALEACEKYGYPTGDEPLCLIVGDAFNAAVDALWPVVDDLQLQVDGLEYAHKTSDEQRSKAMTENQKLRARVAGLSETIRTAATYLRAVIPKDAENCDPEVQMLHSFEETLARIEVEPRNVWSGPHDELLEEIYGRCDHDAPITIIEWPNPVQEGGE